MLPIRLHSSHNVSLAGNQRPLNHARRDNELCGCFIWRATPIGSRHPGTLPTCVPPLPSRATTRGDMGCLRPNIFFCFFGSCSRFDTYDQGSRKVVEAVAVGLCALQIRLFNELLSRKELRYPRNHNCWQQSKTSMVALIAGTVGLNRSCDCRIIS